MIPNIAKRRKYLLLLFCLLVFVSFMTITLEIVRYPAVKKIDTLEVQIPEKRRVNNDMVIKVKCGETSNEKVTDYFGEVKSDMNNWTYKTKTACAWNDIGDQFYQKRRRKLSIRCIDDSVLAWYTETNNSINIDSNDFGDPCLERYIQKCCVGGQRIPNVVHYIWYSRGELHFIPFLSLLSVIRFVNPCVIVFHGQAPYGKYWDAFTYFWPDIIILKREQPKLIFGKQIKYMEHSSDIMRIEALMKYGGIYMDTDTVLVKPIDVLRQHSCVMSSQKQNMLGSAFVMSEKNGSFIQQWLNGYRYNYTPDSYIYNAMVFPFSLTGLPENKNSVHVEPDSLSRPTGMERMNIYRNTNATYNWSHIYGIHLYSRLYKKPVSEQKIRSLNSVFGAISRHIYYGKKELCL